MREIKRRFDPGPHSQPRPLCGKHLTLCRRPPLRSEQHPSSFDAHHPPEKKYIDDCVHCGFCLPACPTYVLWGEEMDSPRGRIYMIKKAAEGQAPLDERFRLHMDNCLGCMACMTACPSGVAIQQAHRADARTDRAQPAAQPRRVALSPLALRNVSHIPRGCDCSRCRCCVYQKCGLRSLVRSTGMTRLLPKRLAAMEALLPDVPARLFERPHSTIQPRTTPRRRVGMLSGCVQQVFFSHVNAATMRVLAAEGCEVIIPREQSCCGALMLHSGMEADAVALAKKMIAVFEAAKVDTIVINSAGCGSTMKEYGHLLRDDPAWAERAAAFSAKCKDISEFLCELAAQAPRHPLKLRVAYHDACHLQHAQGVREQPRRLLAGIPSTRSRRNPGGHVSAAVRRACSTCCSPRQPANSAAARLITFCPRARRRWLRPIPAACCNL